MTGGAPWQPEALLAEALVIGHPEGAGAGVRAFFMGGRLSAAVGIVIWEGRRYGKLGFRPGR